MTRVKRICLFLAIAAAFLLGRAEAADAQNNGGSSFLPYVVEKGDTTFMDSLPPAFSTAGMSKKDIRRYKKLVGDFATVYPYSILARKLVRAADSTFAAGHMTKLQKEKYVNDLQKKIIVSYESTARSLHMSQGRLLMSLIDRETGQSPYQLIRDYKNGMAAGFWQGMAKVFGVSMKSHYDPNGADKDTEMLINLWNKGQFPALYYSLYGKYPVIPKVPDNISAFLD